ncbi:MAG: hypothetical protein KJP08_03600 [Gammaproteobacteria bacterium]|nr:hypothetical protein [Gammaproteobacteria bacterium]NNF49472.1 hypothetical protein [Woeseiaceae bacterium]MBT8093872.1 hypothetical protein [Gammaproteobacteria bacterium]MBT8105937.1 hypothetical protein [Gammaproteobacteria bacterium]NNK25951.1 hypothetical protein [Woeseiaceae bacterium]
MTSWPAILQGGALAGLALLLPLDATAEDSLRERVHDKYKHESYMLVEDKNGARLFLFGDGPTEVELIAPPAEPFVAAAIEKTRSADARMRVRGLVELAGAEDPAALDAALTLLTDPSAAVRDEAQSLILDHPNGASVARALGLEEEAPAGRSTRVER